MKRFNKTIQLFFCLFTGLLWSAAYGNDDAWTWHYSRKMNHESLQKEKESEVILRQEKVPAFTQLIFSWNAFRPPVGHFDFYVSVKDSDKGTWSPWHRMIKWGADAQQSFRAKHADSARYEYVRFEVDHGTANGFRIKVTAENNADIGLLKELHVNISDFSKFKRECPKSLHDLATVTVNNVPKFSQLELDHPRNTGLCSPTACSMVVSYLTKDHVDTLSFAEGAFDRGLDTYGSWPFNMAHAFERSKGKISFATYRLNSFKDIHKQLTKGMPVLVSVRGDLQGAPKPYENGHFMVVVGWDAKDKSVICHDPAFEKSSLVVTKYPIDSFIGAWERSRRLSYIAKPHSF